MNERDIFLAAIEIAEPAERAAYVEKTCGSNATLRVQVEELLKTHGQASQFLETPAAAGQSAIAETFVTGHSVSASERHPESSSGESALRSEEHNV